MNEETKKPEEDKAKEAKEEQKKRKKINRFTLEELEKKIQEVKEKMGGLTSSYAQQLLRRKEQLLQDKASETQSVKESKNEGGDNATDA